MRLPPQRRAKSFKPLPGQDLIEEIVVVDMRHVGSDSLYPLVGRGLLQSKGRDRLPYGRAPPFNQP
ncbi:hypothetical protein AMTR_s00045p00134220 [Amborella trichopoda]|uniref:Uncharacterized protein n=1 Tax=Amborella trichopoda TaxID=13333 RepID=W1P513_AMBTC|nr:hypothetical protein AMTR_s00045p00134220 [Amborella trichopoda]